MKGPVQIETLETVFEMIQILVCTKPYRLPEGLNWSFLRPWWGLLKALMGPPGGPYEALRCSTVFEWFFISFSSFLPFPHRTFFCLPWPFPMEHDGALKGPWGPQWGLLRVPIGWGLPSGAPIGPPEEPQWGPLRAPIGPPKGLVGPLKGPDGAP
jgi:hypothetical protein